MKKNVSQEICLRQLQEDTPMRHKNPLVSYLAPEFTNIISIIKKPDLTTVINFFFRYLDLSGTKIDESLLIA